MKDGSEEIGGFFWTCERVLLAPRAFFSRPAAARSRLTPLSFAVRVAALALPGAIFMDLLLRDVTPGDAVSTALRAVVVSPLVAVVSVYITAALTHFWLIVVGGRLRPFQETLACVCYASAASLLGVGPIVGTAVALVWRLVALCIGLKRTHETTRARAVVAVIVGAAMPGALALAVRNRSVIESFHIPSGAMIPTLMVGDHIFVNKLAYGPRIPFTDARLYQIPPKRADLMVFKFPENKEQDFIKRAIAGPGDTLEAINGRPIINGWLVPHCYVGQLRFENHAAELYIEYLEDKSYFTLFEQNPDEQTCGSSDDCAASGLTCRNRICGILQGPFKAGREEVWVMGDNRNNSHDSRSWNNGRGGGVPFENLKGRAMFVWMSFGPGGEVARDRLFVELHGRPALPASQEAELRPAVEKCLKERPPIEKTTPPRAR